MDNKQVVLNFIKAADSDDFAAVEKLFGTKHQFHSSMSPAPMDTQHHLGMMKAFHDGFSNARHEVLDLFESGSKVVLRGIWHCTHTGTFNNIPASGKSINLPFIMIIEVENNEMRNQWIELDSMTMMMQMGAMPTPEAVN
ncbi:MAG: ester cyclase [Bacteroidia bacterium]